MNRVFTIIFFGIILLSCKRTYISEKIIENKYIENGYCDEDIDFSIEEVLNYYKIYIGNLYFELPMNYYFSYIDSTKAKEYEDLIYKEVVRNWNSTLLSIEIYNKNSIPDYPLISFPKPEIVIGIERYINEDTNNLDIEWPFRLIKFNNITAVDSIVLPESSRDYPLKRYIMFFDEEYFYYVLFHSVTKYGNHYIEYTHEMLQEIKTQYKNNEKLSDLLEELLDESKQVINSMYLR